MPATAVSALMRMRANVTSSPRTGVSLAYVASSADSQKSVKALAPETSADAMK